MLDRRLFAFGFTVTLCVMRAKRGEKNPPNQCLIMKNKSVNIFFDNTLCDDIIDSPLKKSMPTVNNSTCTSQNFICYVRTLPTI